MAWWSFVCPHALSAGRSPRGSCWGGVLELEWSLDANLSGNEPAPRCLPNGHEAAPTAVGESRLPRCSPRFRRSQRTHANVCCPAGVSLHHRRRRKSTTPIPLPLSSLLVFLHARASESFIAPSPIPPYVYIFDVVHYPLPTRRLPPHDTLTP